MTERVEATVRDPQDDSVAIGAFFETFWSYRRAIGLAMLTVIVVFLLAALVVSLSVPVERLGTLRFRLLFDGAEKGEYPNGAVFSSAEIVGAPVMTEVYRNNDLQRFGDYEDFKASMFILAANPEIEMLTYEYQGKLADTRLTPVDRARIEEEFTTKRAALVDPVLSLNLRRTERLISMPAELIEKTLTDTLRTWAEQADARKGATRYNVPVLSKDILDRRVIEREDYLVAIDILRSKTNRVIHTADLLGDLPGAQAIRTGQDKISLIEVRSNLEDVVRFKLEPLLDLVRSEGVTKNAHELRLYATNQLFQLRLERERSQALVTTLQDSLTAYTAQRLGGTSDGQSASGAGVSSAPAISPQLDRSFFDRLMEFSTAEDDQAYRRKLTDRIIKESERVATTEREAAYYEDLVQNLSTTSSRAIGTKDTVALITTRTAEAFDQVSKGIDQISALYDELSAQNLNPSTTVYAITEPFTLTTTRAVTGRILGLYFVLVLAITFIVTGAGSLVHHAWKQR
jgi:hypothetical protein